MSPASPRRRIRLPVLVVGFALAAALVVLAVSGMKGTLTYYRTPTEVASQQPVRGQHIRLSGMVVPGSVRYHDGTVRFTLTDGAHDVHVTAKGTPPSDFRAGQDATVEGTLRSPTAFTADRVLVRHSNEYRAPSTAGPGDT